VFAITSVVAGVALDRWGARITFSVGAGLLALGLLLSSLINSLWQLILSYGVVVGLGITILGLGLQAGLLAGWFRKRLGVALGLAFAGTGLGTLTLTPGVESLISAFGWRIAYRVLALLALLLIPIIIIFLRRSPAVLGLWPDGDSPPTENKRQRHLPRGQWTMGMALRTQAFWLVMAAAVGAIGPLRMLTVHQLAVVVDAGFNRLYAAAVIGASGAVTAVAFILFGAISDRIGRQRTYLIGSLCLLAAIGLLSSLHSAEQSRWLLAYAILLGLGEGSRSSLVTAVASDLFPGRALGTINGAVGSAFAVGAAFFPWFAGWIFDVNGSYSSAFVAAAVAIVMSTLALWLAPVVMNREQGQRIGRIRNESGN